jgi:hypothetical protein
MCERFTDSGRSADDNGGASNLRRHFHTDGLPNKSRDGV